MIYEIFTYGGGDYVAEVLNAVVRIMDGNSFVTALKISLLFGLFSIFLDIAINGNFTKGVKYYLSFLLVYNTLFVPKVDVIITDPIKPVQNDRKVDNVPFGLAFSSHIISTFGNWMTNVFGMNFILPNDLQYNKNGMLFGNALIQNIFNTRISDDRTSSNFNNYVRQCVIPAINLKRIDIEDFLKYNSIQDIMNAGKNGVLAYDFIDVDGNRKINLCNSITEISNDINIELNKIIDEQNEKFNKNNNASIDNINQYILGIQQSITKTFEQNLIANAISDSTQEYLAMTDADAGTINYAITKDNIQKKQNSILQWIQAGKFLPLLKIVIETMFYALFPIIILLTMLPNGIKIFKNYIFILLAIQIWSPLYAILNLMMTLEQKYRLSGIISQTSNSISLYNKQAIMDITQGIQMQAGLLAFVIPVLSFKIVQGIQNFGEGVVSGIASSGSFATGQVVSEVTSGNISYGNGSFKNISYDNTSAHKHDTNEVYSSGIKSTQTGDGITKHEYKDGLTTTDFGKRLTSNLGVNFNSTEDQVNSNRIALNQAKSATESRANAFTKSLQDLKSFSFVDSSGNGQVHNVSNSDAIKFNAGASGRIGIGGNNVHINLDYDKVMTWADSNNISREDRKTLSDLIQKTNQYQTSYNQSLTEQDSKQRALDYSLATSTHSGINWNNEVERYMRQTLNWSQEQINGASQQEIQKIGNQYIKDRIFNRNIPKMLPEINNSLENSEKQYDNQTNMIDSRYNYQKNYLNGHQMKNADFSHLGWNIKNDN